MYSLTICFGPAATTWAFLFKEKDAAESVRDSVEFNVRNNAGSGIVDDFGQYALINLPIHGLCLEDLDQTEAARIQRSLAEERTKVKLMDAAKADPVIGAAILRQQRGAPVLTPMGGGFR